MHESKKAKGKQNMKQTSSSIFIDAAHFSQQSRVCLVRQWKAKRPTRRLQTH